MTYDKWGDVCQYWLLIIVAHNSHQYLFPSGSDWRYHALNLLCKSGSNLDGKALAIRSRMKKSDSSASWMVWVLDRPPGATSSFSKSTGESLWVANTCDDVLYVWRRDSSLFTNRQKKCSSREQRQMKALMRSAAARGGSNADVKERLKSTIKDFGSKFHVIGVITGSYGKRTYTYTSCSVTVHSNGYTIHVYIKS